MTVVFTARDQVAVERRSVPEPAAGQVLVRALASLVSTGTECIVLQSNFEPDTGWASWGRFPFLPGYSMVGRVLAVGPGTSRLRVGQRVVARRPHQQYFTAPDDLLEVPEGISDRDASWFAIASIVQNAVRRARIEMGEVVAVVGAGILGQLAMQYSLLAGASRVVGLDIASSRLALAGRYGATDTLEVPVAEAEAAVRDLTAGRMADVVFDATGGAAVFGPALRLCRRLGRFVLLGDTGHPSQQCLSHEVMRRGITITAAHDTHPPKEGNEYYFWSHRNMQSLFFRFVQQDRLRVAPLTTHVVSPLEAPHVYADLLERRGDYLGVVFDWGACGGAQD